MRAIIIDDNYKFAVRILTIYLKNFNKLFATSVTPFFKNECIQNKTIEDFLNKLPQKDEERNEEETIKIENDYIFFINCSVNINSCKRTDFKGIEIMKWLRLKGFNNHCILYSFLSIQSITELNPLNNILLSKGITFIQLYPDRLLLKDTFYGKRSERDNLLPYFRGEIDLIEMRHKNANLYGMERMLHWLKNVMNEQIEIEIKNRNDYDYLLLTYCFDNVNTSSNIKYKFTRNQIEKIRKESPKVLFIDDMADHGWADIIKMIIYGHLEVNSDLFKYINVDDSIKKDEIINAIKKDKKNCYDLVITDLRLYSNESKIHDYTKFVIFEVISAIKCELDNKNRSKFWYIKFLFLTASNNLSLYKQLLNNNNKYTPNGLALKEGPDLLLDTEQSYKNFSDFINLLYMFLNKENKKKSLDILDLSDADSFEEYQILKKLKELPIKIDNMRNSFDKIIIDTNILIEQTIFNFLQEYNTVKMIIEHYTSSIWLHSSVIQELKWQIVRETNKNGKTIVSEQIHDRKRALSEIYLELFKIYDVSIIQENIDYSNVKNPNDLADKYIKNEMLQNNNKKVILLSKDVKNNGPANKDFLMKCKNISSIPFNLSLYEFFSR